MGVFVIYPTRKASPTPFGQNLVRAEGPVHGSLHIVRLSSSSNSTLQATRSGSHSTT